MIHQLDTKFIVIVGNVEAMYNWWGSNATPSNKVYGTVDTTSCLILTLTANPTVVGKNLTSKITADITKDATGEPIT